MLVNSKSIHNYLLFSNTLPKTELILWQGLLYPSIK